MNDFTAYRNHMLRHKELLQESEQDRLAKDAMKAGREGRPKLLTTLFNQLYKVVINMVKQRVVTEKQTKSYPQPKDVLHETGL